MLRFERPPARRSVTPVRASRTRRLRLAFGAVSFELLADEGAYTRLVDWEPRFRVDHDDPRAGAHAL